VIPELEAMLSSYKSRGRVNWTDHERAVLRKYWGRVPAGAIAKQLNKTISAVRNQVQYLKLKVGDNRE